MVILTHKSRNFIKITTIIASVKNFIPRSNQSYYSTIKSAQYYIIIFIYLFISFSAREVLVFVR